MTAAHEEARYAQVLRFPSRQELVRRLPPLVAGLFIIGLSIAISVRAELGVAPWDVLHQGLAKATHTSIGVVLVIVGLIVLLAIVGFGLGGGLYIGSGLGPGPRDGLMTAITARGHRLRVVRTTIECSALVVGFLLGGKVGVGTVLIALTIGSLTHAGLRRFHLPVSDDAAEVMGE